MIRLGRKREPRSAALDPVVGELLNDAQVEAGALRHDVIGTEHVLLALVKRSDEIGSLLREWGLEPDIVRADIRRMVGDRPAPEEAFDRAALAVIGVDLEAVRSRVEAEFGAGALERARRHRGTCRGAAFGMSPRLKQALAAARRQAVQRGGAITAASAALGLAEQRDSAASRILDAHAISAERLRVALETGTSNACPGTGSTKPG